MNRVKILSLSSVVALMLQTGFANADDDIREIKAFSEGLGLVSLEQAKAAALAAKPGVIDDVDLEDRSFGKGWDYEFEIMDVDGNEWEVYVDAKTGEVRKVEKEWF